MCDKGLHALIHKKELLHDGTDSNRNDCHGGVGFMMSSCELVDAKNDTSWQKRQVRTNNLLSNAVELKCEMHLVVH